MQELIVLERTEYFTLVRQAIDSARRARVEGRREGIALRFCKECGGELPCKTIGCTTCRDRNKPKKQDA